MLITEQPVLIIFYKYTSSLLPASSFGSTPINILSSSKYNQIWRGWEVGKHMWVDVSLFQNSKHWKTDYFNRAIHMFTLINRYPSKTVIQYLKIHY